MFCLNIIVFIDYKNIGCYKDTWSRANIPTLEGKDPILDGQYSSRKNPIAKNALAARKRGYSRGTQRGYSSKPLNIALLNVF